MTLYHGSYLEITEPDLVHSRKMWTLDVVFM